MPTLLQQTAQGEEARRTSAESIREGFDLDHSIYALNSWIANLPSRKVRA